MQIPLKVTLEILQAAYGRRTDEYKRHYEIDSSAEVNFHFQMSGWKDIASAAAVVGFIATTGIVQSFYRSSQFVMVCQGYEANSFKDLAANARARVNSNLSSRPRITLKMLIGRHIMPLRAAKLCESSPSLFMQLVDNMHISPIYIT